ncbi:MAG: radical SAM protein [Patescibacteria group bacterium]
MASPFEVKEIKAKTILSKATLKEADYDYSCNPYTGCRFGCVYCYASFMGRMVGKKTEDWGNFVFAKINAPELLKSEILKLKNNGRGKVIWFSSVTDPYQGMEAKYQLTRKCLQVLVDANFQGEVSFLTKSDMVLRDIDIFKRLSHVEVGMTITSTDDSISRYFEKFAPPASARLAALQKLHDEGIETYAFIGPLLPHFVASDEALDTLFSSVHNVGVKKIFVEFLNLSGYIRNRLKIELKDMDPKIWEEFYGSQKKDYREELSIKVYALVKKYGFKLRMDKPLYHKEMH